MLVNLFWGKALFQKKEPDKPILFKVARPGFEPRQTEPKSVVLPLYYRAIPPFMGLQK